MRADRSEASNPLALTPALSRKRERGKSGVCGKMTDRRPETKRTMATAHPIDTNQIRSRIGDLKERVASLRGYL